MKLISTPLEGCFILEPTLFEDARGYFFESYNHQNFKDQSGLNVNFVQDNEAYSHLGALRGLHFQKGKHAQAKLVRVIRGKVLDVAVDLRANSSTFGQYFSVILSGENKKQLFVPRGFAHGYAVLENDTVFSYKCDNYYCKDAEGGIRYDDPTLAIDWHLESSQITLSEKDVVLPFYDADSYQNVF
ncbi:dTDP-4-dehydrorhamnose 3,5-epimerase [Tenacibaculum litopenaei]|uniref:dTDP-4-dehydrorhamnose 3,5-epimerase n=1 Tax=Tenacibaculum litopenaei TaxID=396016 RepID=UPI003893C11F